MELTSPKIIKELLLKYEALPNKTMGQNFLIDKNILQKIITASNIRPTDIVLEVGPGIGTLTKELATRAKKVICVEKDQTMIKILAETLADFKNIEIIQADIIHYSLQTANYKLIANIPYYLTSPLIRKFLESENQPTEIVIMVQKEVAQRICAKPPKMNLLALSVQFYAEPKIISYVSKSCFLPAPKIDSAIIKIVPRSPTSREAGSLTSPDLFFKIVKAGFSHPRKQIFGNFVKTLKLEKNYAEKWLEKNNISPTQRAETLSLEDWKNLAKTFL